MSLTRRLESPAIRSEFTKAVFQPTASRPPVLVPRVAKSPQRVGIAFDYAMRFGLARRGWGVTGVTAAERGVRVAERSLSQDPAASSARGRLEAALSALGVGPRIALDAGDVKACFQLAGLDIIYRERSLSQLTQPATDQEIQEVLDLLGIVPWESLRPKRRLLLNPGFNEGSKLVGGADADIVIDSTLIEIKTLHESVIDRKALHQVVGYAILSEHYGMDGAPADSQHPVDSVGFYFSRSGVIVSFSLDELCGHENRQHLHSLLVAPGPLASERHRHGS